MKKNVAGQKVGAQMVSASDGSAFTGSVTVAVTGDAGTQATGSVGSGACTHEGNGYHTYAPAQAETNYELIAFTFTGTGAVPATVQVFTAFPQTGDNFARLGAPAGASVSADVAAIKTDTGNLVTRITSTLFSGITQLSHWLGAMAGKQAANATAQTEIRASGAGSGTFDPTTDSNEALRDNTGTAGAGLTIAAVTGAVGSVTGAVGSVTGNVGGNVVGSVASVTADVGITQGGADKVWTSAARTLTSFGTLVADTATAVWGAATRLLTAGTNIVLAKGTGITGFNDLSAAQVNAEADTAIADAALATAANLATVAGYLDTEIGDIKATTDKLDDTLEDDAGTYRFTANALEEAPTGGGGSGLDAAGVRAAIGLASANLDTQLADLPTNAELATSQAAADDATLAAIAGLNNLSSAQAQTAAAAALTAYDPPTKAEIDSAHAATDALIADVPTNAELTTALGTADDAVLAAIAALNNVSTADLASAISTYDGPTKAELDAAIATLATAANLALAKTAIDGIKSKTDSLTFTETGMVDANLQAVNDVVLTGTGVEGDEWGPEP